MIRVWRWSENGLREEPATGPAGEAATGAPDDAVLWIDVRSPQREDWATLRNRYPLTPVLWNRLQAGHSTYGVEAASGTVIFSVTLPGGRPCLFLWKEGAVATVCEDAPEAWERLRDRLAAGGSTLPRSSAWLLYFLLEEILNSYGESVERLERRLEPIEARFVRETEPPEQAAGRDDAARPRRGPRRRRPRPVWSEPNWVPQLSLLHRRAGQLQRLANGLGDVLDRLLEYHYNSNGKGAPAREIRPHLRALRDHANRLTGRLENVRELAATLMDLRLALATERTNRLILRLTVLSTIFLPLTFLTGIYGMNFRHMPELDIPWAYPALLAFMLVLGLSLWWFLRREYE